MARHDKREKLVIRLTEQELAKLQVYADHKGVAMSHIIREYIRRLPRTLSTANSPQIEDLEGECAAQ